MAVEQGKRLVKKPQQESTKTETTRSGKEVEEEKVESDVEAGTEVAVREAAGLPATINFEEDMAGGFENVTSKDFKIPILRVLQSGSPEVDDDNPKYIEGAKAGSLLNISTKKVYDGKEGVWLVPCAYHKKWVEFVPRELGGGYVDEYLPTDPIIKTAVKAEKGTNKVIKETGNTLTETGYFPCLLIEDGGVYDQVVLTVSSSAWNFAKDWLNIMRKKVIIGKDGRPMKNPPAFWSHAYRIGSQTVKNSQYSWKQFSIIEDRKLTDSEVDLYMAGREFNRISNSLEFGPDQNEDEYSSGSQSVSDDDREY